MLSEKEHERARQQSFFTLVNPVKAKWSNYKSGTFFSKYSVSDKGTNVGNEWVYEWVSGYMSEWEIRYAVAPALKKKENRIFQGKKEYFFKKIINSQIPRIWRPK